MSVTEIQPLPKTGTRMSLEEFRALNLPEESSLILLNGIVYDEADQGDDMTKRNHQHSLTEATLAYLLNAWRGSSGMFCQVHSGEVGCELTGQTVSVGINVAIFPQSVVAGISSDFPFIVGTPLLAVEILSPSDKTSGIQQKVDLYLKSGVELVWVVDPHFRTVVVHRNGHVPEMYASGSFLVGEDALPGLKIAVTEIFE